MPQSLGKNLIHLIFSTKNRTPFLTDEIRPALHSYAAGIFKEQDSPALIINSVGDHLHALFNLHRTRALADVVMHVKKGTSRHLKTLSSSLADFHWQNGYGVLSVSQSVAPEVSKYIKNQAEHHRRMSFQDEFRAFLQRHEMEFDEKYVWD